MSRCSHCPSIQPSRAATCSTIGQYYVRMCKATLWVCESVKRTWRLVLTMGQPCWLASCGWMRMMQTSSWTACSSVNWSRSVGRSLCFETRGSWLWRRGTSRQTRMRSACTGSPWWSYTGRSTVFVTSTWTSNLLSITGMHQRRHQRFATNSMRSSCRMQSSSASNSTPCSKSLILSARRSMCLRLHSLCRKKSSIVCGGLWRHPWGSWPVRGLLLSLTLWAIRTNWSRSKPTSAPPSLALFATRVVMVMTMWAPDTSLMRWDHTVCSLMFRLTAWRRPFFWRFLATISMKLTQIRTVLFDRPKYWLADSRRCLYQHASLFWKLSKIERKISAILLVNFMQKVRNYSEEIIQSASSEACFFFVALSIHHDCIFSNFFLLYFCALLAYPRGPSKRSCTLYYAFCAERQHYLLFLSCHTLNTNFYVGLFFHASNYRPTINIT